MKIILAVNTLGSFISHRRGLFLKLRESHEVSVILPDSEDRALAIQQIPEDRLLGISFSRKGVNPFAELRTVFDYYRLYRDETPDLVHHFTIKPVIYGTIAARIAGVPKIVNSITGLGFVFTSNSVKAKVLGFIVKNLYKLCLSGPRVQVIFQNEDDRAFFVSRGILSLDKTFLIEGSGVDVQKFQPSEMANPVPVIFVASRLLIEKGISEFMEALRILRNKNIPFRAMIAGNIDPHNPGSYSEKQVQEWQNENLAEFLGFQSDMVSLLEKVDIACLPSYREGLPMSLLEAMAAGKPVVTTDAPGCRSTVPEGKNGYLVPVKKSDALATALEKLLFDPQLRMAMGAESRRLAVESFSTEKITSEIARVYLS